MIKKQNLVVILLAYISLTTVVSGSYDTTAEIDSLTEVLGRAHAFNEKQMVLKALSNCYQNKGDWEGYEEVVQQMLLLQEEKTDSFYLAETYNKLGISSCCLGKNKDALRYFGKALEINVAQKNDVLAANSYENLGIVYKDMGNYTSAVESQLKSLALRKEKNSPRIFNNYIKLSDLLELLGDGEKVDFYLGLAKGEMNQRDSISPRTKALFYNQLGEIYARRGLRDSSIVCYRKVIFNSDKIGWNLGVAEGLGNMAHVFYQAGQLDSAIIYHKKSLKLSQSISNKQSIAEEYLSLAKLYEETGILDSVMYFASSSLTISQQSDLLSEQSKALRFIADFYSSEQNYRKANHFLQKHYAIEDSISSSDVKNNIAELATKYETKVKEQQIELLTNENLLKNQRMWLFIASTIILILAILIGIFMFMRNRRENHQRQEMLKQQLLRSQMNPHFLFNALGSIQNFMLKNEPRKAAGYLNNFASLTRNILEHSAQEFVSVSDEVETLRNYMELERMRLENSFEFEISCDNDMETEFINIPPMLIQPFIENAIKHGLNDIKYKGLLELKFEEKNSVLHIEIIDNGVGIDHARQKSPKSHRSMSMNIFEQRRIVLAKRSKKAIGLEVCNRCTLNGSDTGTLVRIQIPILN